MAYNDIVINETNSLLKNLLSKKTNSDFAEENISNEFDLINYEIKEKDLKKSLTKINALKQLDANQFNKLKELIDFKLKKIKLEKENLVTFSQEYYNQIEIKKINLVSSTKELRQKMSILSGFSNVVKFAFEENFNNYFQINTNVKNLLNVDTNSNICTLPIEEKTKLIVNSIKINKESNLIPGNNRTGENKLILSLLSNDQNSYFECFKYDSGPGKLIISGEFKKEEIVNQFEISAIPVNGIVSLEIEDIIYTDAFNKSISIKKLIDNKEQKLNINSLENEEALNIYHLPIKAYKYKIVLKTKEFQIVEKRKVFKISLKSISFYKNKYKDEGNLKSKSITSPESIYQLQGVAKVYPDKSNSYIQKLQFSIDGEDSYINDNFGTFINGEQKQVNYNYSLTKNLSNLNVRNIIKKDLFLLDIKTYLKNYNKKVSPISYNINEDKENFLIYLPDVLRRSIDIEEAIKIGAASTVGLNRILLPKILSKLDIKKDELIIFFNNQKWLQVDLLEEAQTEGFFYIEDNFEAINVNLTNVNYFTCKLLLKPKIMPMLKTTEGYYIKINENFDLDKKKIKLKNLSKSIYEKEEFLAKGETSFFLEEEYIVEGSFKLYYENESQWIEDTSEIEIDYLTGRLFTFEHEEYERKVIYSYYKESEIKDFSVWNKENNFFGLFINEEDIALENIKQNLNELPNNFFYLSDEARSSINSSKSFVLKEAGIIKGSLSLEENMFEGDDFKEVEFVNGYIEFLNLKKILEDQVPQIEANSENKVTFTLSEKIYSTNDVVVYKDDEIVSTEIEFDASKRICTLTLVDGDLIAEGYHLSYYYIDEENYNEDIKKYSVNYDKGILYTSENILNPETKTINYEVNRVLLNYSIVSLVEDYFFEENVIKVYTENLPERNKQIKFGFYQSIDNFSIEGLEDYYSPLLYKIKIEMS
jgi:hypothetical protein